VRAGDEQRANAGNSNKNVIRAQGSACADPGSWRDSSVWRHLYPSRPVPFDPSESRDSRAWSSRCPCCDTEATLCEDIPTRSITSKASHENLNRRIR